MNAVGQTHECTASAMDASVTPRVKDVGRTQVNWSSPLNRPTAKSYGRKDCTECHENDPSNKH